MALPIPFAAGLRDGTDQVVELLQVHRICVRDGAEFCFALSPVNPLKTLPGPGACRSVWFSGGPDEYIDWTSVTLVDEHRDRAAFHDIQAPTLQSETLVREIAYGDSKLKFGVEP